MSGLRRPLVSTRTGPRLLKPAMMSLRSVAPTLNEAWYRAGGSKTVLHPEPLLPAETTTTIPAAWVFSTIDWRTLGSVQPSLGGQPQELLIAAGAIVGSGF